MDKIKPCPFCGESAELHQSPPGYLPIWYIGCDGKKGSLCPGYAYKVSPAYTTKKVALEMWNSRLNNEKE